MNEFPLIKNVLNDIKNKFEGDSLSKSLLVITDLTSLLLPDRVKEGDRPIFSWYSEGVILDIELVPRRDRFNYSLIHKGQLYDSGFLTSINEVFNKVLEIKGLGNSTIIINEETKTPMSYPKQKDLPRR